MNIYQGETSADISSREIVDESDVYVDVHKAIRRLTPAPRAKRMQHAEAAATAAVAKKTTKDAIQVDISANSEEETLKIGSYGALSDAGGYEQRPKTAIFKKRRGSGHVEGRNDGPSEPFKASLDEVRQQLRLGPANRAAKPLTNRKDVFKTKQGTGITLGNSRMPPRSVTVGVFSPTAMETEARERDETTPLLGGAAQNGKANGNKQADGSA